MEDKNQSTVKESVQAELEIKSNQDKNPDVKIKNEGDGEKEGLEQHGSIKNTK